MSTVKAIAVLVWWVPASVMAAGTRLEYARAPGAESCPEATVVRASVTSRLGYDPFSDAGERLLRCQIQRDGAGLRAQIDVEDARGNATGRRVLKSRRSDCADLAPALLLVMSMAARGSVAEADPSGPRRAGRPSAKEDTPRPPPEVAQDPPPEPDLSAVAPPADRDAAPRREAEDRVVPARPTAESLSRATVVAAAPAAVREPFFDGVAVGAGALGSLGALPHPGLGAEAAVGLTHGAASLAVELRLDAPATSTTTAGQARLWLATGWLVPCARWSWFLGCALAGAGALHGAGEGVAAARSSSSFWFGAGPRAAVRAGLSSRTALVLHADLLFVPSRIVTRLGDPPAAVWKTPLVSAALGIAVTHDFR